MPVRRAGDFEGAWKSIRTSADWYGRNASLHHLAEELAGTGRRQESLAVLEELDSDHGWRQESLNDTVRLRWLEHLIKVGDFERSQPAVEQFESKRYRPDALRKLAVAHARKGDKSESAKYFKLAIDAAGETTGFDRARALWETGGAQLSVGAVNDA